MLYIECRAKVSDLIAQEILLGEHHTGFMRRDALSACASLANTTLALRARGALGAGAVLASEHRGGFAHRLALF